MTIVYENTSADAVAWYSYYVFQTRTGRKLLRRRRHLTILLYSAVMGLLCIGLLPSPWWAVGCTVLTATGAYLLSPWQERQEIPKEASRLERDGFFRLFLGDKQISLLPDGVHTTWDGGEVIRKWQTLARWTSTDTHLILHWSDSDDDFSIIPLRAFHSKEQARRFLELLQGYQAGKITAPLAVSPTVTAVSAQVPQIAPQTTPTVPTTVTKTEKTTSGGSWWQDRNHVGDTSVSSTNSQSTVNRVS